MIPDLYWPVIPIGPLHIQVWGLFVATGIGVAIYVAKRFAEQRKLNGELVVDAAFWVIIGSLLGARLFFVVTELSLYVNDWLGVFRFWQGGMSVSGGFLGAAIAGYWFFRSKNVSFWQYADTIVFALPLGLAIGRLGCFFIFDHPGSVTTFFLGEVYYGDGLVRHNHGLYLALSGAILFAVFVWLRYKQKFLTKNLVENSVPNFIPWFVIIFLVWDGAFRVLTDANRILDSAFFGLTAAQYMGMASIAAGIAIFWKHKKR